MCYLFVSRDPTQTSWSLPNSEAIEQGGGPIFWVRLGYVVATVLQVLSGKGTRNLLIQAATLRREVGYISDTSPGIDGVSYRTKSVSWIQRQSLGGQAVILIAAGLAKYGIGIFVSASYMVTLASNYSSRHLAKIIGGEAASYLLSSPVSAVVAGFFGFSTLRSYVSFHFALAIGSLIAPLLFPSVRRDPDIRVLILILLVGGATLPVLFGWIGSYDPTSLTAAASLGLAASATASGAAMMVFAFNNAPEALLSLLVLSAVMVTHDARTALRRVPILCASALFGYVGIRMLTSYWGGSTSRLTWFKTASFHQYLIDGVSNWPLILLASLGVGWFIFLQGELLRFPATKTLVICSLASAILIPLIALDESRITSSVIYHSMLYVARTHFPRLIQSQRVKILNRSLYPALFLLIPIAWSGSILYSGWHSMWNVLRLIVA